MRAVLIIIIENCKNQTISGWLQSFYEEKPVCFHGLDHMLFLIEEILDSEGVPAENGECRHLVKMDPVKTKRRTKKITHPEKVGRMVKFCPVRNRLKTGENVFTVTIYSRQNASIQGIIRNSRGSASFRSGLEVIRIMNECMFASCLGVYDKGEYGREIEASEIMHDMRQALEQEQFIIYFQPKFDLATDTDYGAEALVRWNHPKAGLIPPGTFIPLFEKSGFIVRLDYYMAEHVCRIIGKWCSDGIKLNPITINLSRITLLDPKLVDILLKVTKKYRVPVSLLNLEITESAYASDSDQIMAAIRMLRRAGFVTMMDDFGSGFSSLNMLKDIDVDVLKVDMNFLSGDILAGKGEIILTSVIRMAGNLGIPVIVEGVETQEQRDFLAAIGCDYVQGYYYAKPMPLEEYERKYIYTHDGTSSDTLPVPAHKRS